MTTVIEGDLEARVLTFAKHSLDRQKLLHYVLENLHKQADAYEREKTDSLDNEVLAFLTGNVDGNQLLGFSIRQLIELFDSYKNNIEYPDFTSDLMKLGSAVAIRYCSQSDDELVRNFVTFLFSLSENSGSIPEGMTTNLAEMYVKTLCGYAMRALRQYCDEKGY